jgi:hypothetical protein
MHALLAWYNDCYYSVYLTLAQAEKLEMFGNVASNAELGNPSCIDIAASYANACHAWLGEFLQ